MKIRKRAKQKNVVLNKEHYTVYQLESMNKNKEIFYFDKDFNDKYDAEISHIGGVIDEIEFRIFTEDLEEIKVILDECGHYTTVAVDKNGKVYYVCL